MWSKIVTRALLNNRNKQLIVRSSSDGPSPSLLRKYERFQKDESIPIYIRGGASDKALFGLTCSLVSIGLVDGFWTLFQMAKPKKK